MTLQELAAETLAIYRATPAQLCAEIERLRGLLANSEMTVREVMADNERLRAAIDSTRAVLHDRPAAQLAAGQRQTSPPVTHLDHNSPTPRALNHE